MVPADAPAGSTSGSRSCQSDPTASGASRTKCELAIELLREQGPHHQGQAFGRFRRRLRPEERGPAAGPARRRCSLGSNSSPACGAMPGCTPCPAPGAVPRGEAGTEAQVGSAAGAAPPGGMWKAKWQVGTAFVYGRQREIRWKEDHLPVASPGLGGASQGDCCLRRGLQSSGLPW